MLKYQDYEPYFQELNVDEKEGAIILAFLEKIIEITIQTYNDRN